MNKYKISRNKKTKNKIIINNKIIIIIIIVIVALLTYLSLFFLAFENIKLNNKLTKEKYANSYMSESSITINFFRQKFSAKLLFSGVNNNYEIINKNIIHISYSLDDTLVYPTLISMLSGLESCNKDNFIVYHLLLSYKFNKLLYYSSYVWLFS